MPGDVAEHGLIPQEKPKETTPDKENVKQAAEAIIIETLKKDPSMFNSDADMTTGRLAKDVEILNESNKKAAEKLSVNFRRKDTPEGTIFSYTAILADEDDWQVEHVWGELSWKDLEEHFPRAE
ncbi:hypothetical protein KKA15_05355 [Patescibacteria group bacterium]|nr:hypothetical protein [Patescibacteria group bacterium]